MCENSMYDNIVCKYPLPLPGFENCEFQTKDTPAGMQDNYEIREDGTLWHEDYTLEFVEDPEAIMGCFLEKKDVEWRPTDLTGSIYFYDEIQPGFGWIEFVAHFSNGKVSNIAVHRHVRPKVKKTAA